MQAASADERDKHLASDDEEKVGAPAAEYAESPELAAISVRERRLMLWLTNISHGANHFQGQMVGPLYPLIMQEFGFGYAQLGLLVALRNGFTSWTQLLYGLITPFINRSLVLGIGNIVLALGTAITGFTGSFLGFLGARCFAAAGSSAQHPIGASILATYYPRNRGSILALNNTIASVGTMLAPLVSGVLITLVGWRQVFWIVAAVSVLMGIAYFFFPDKMQRRTEAGPKKAIIARSLGSYWRVARNRNFLLVGLVFMVGAAGRGGEDIQSYFATHFVNDLSIQGSFASLFNLLFGDTTEGRIALAGVLLTLLQVGGLGGPLFFGWLSDKINRKGVIQGSLLLSALSTALLAHQGVLGFSLIFNLLFQGAVTSSRGTLTQALIADSTPSEDQDAAFSVYFFLGFFSTPLWAIGTGLLMDAFGFTTTFTLLSLSYVAAIVLMFFVRDPSREGAALAR